jgi:glucosamine--fructose-6-phosphate aminotransferase (isomerizing)
MLVEWNSEAAEKGGYEHFMMKEIHEEPRAIRDTILPRLRDGQIRIPEIDWTQDWIQSIRQIRIVACGTAYHAGMVGKYLIEKICRIPVEVDFASEFRYREPLIDEQTLVIIISQSGETLDTLAAMREARRLGGHILAVVNVVGSSIAREADAVLYTAAGPEIAVASTKAYNTQLAALYLLTIKLASVLDRIDAAKMSYYLELKPWKSKTKSNVLLPIISMPKTSFSSVAAWIMPCPWKPHSSSRKYPTSIPKPMPAVS